MQVNTVLKANTTITAGRSKHDVKFNIRVYSPTPSSRYADQGQLVVEACIRARVSDQVAVLKAYVHDDENHHHEIMTDSDSSNGISDLPDADLL